MKSIPTEVFHLQMTLSSIMHNGSETLKVHRTLCTSSLCIYVEKTGCPFGGFPFGKTHHQQVFFLPHHHNISEENICSFLLQSVTAAMISLFWHRHFTSPAESPTINEQFEILHFVNVEREHVCVSNCTLIRKKCVTLLTRTLYGPW